MDASNAPLPENTARPVSKRIRPAAVPPRLTKTVRRKRRSLPAPPTRRSVQARQWGWRVFILVFAFACGPFVIGNTLGQRALPAIGIGCILLLLMQRSPGAGVVWTLLYLSLLGGVRRWIVPVLGSTSTDPLLLIAPALVLVNFLNLFLTRNIPADTRLARALLWLLGIMFVEIFNPIQGGIGVGLAGVLFMVVPMLWYYYGRSIGHEAILRRMLSTVVCVAILGALYGLYQTYFGLLPVEKEWLELNKASYNALYVTFSVTRVFSFFTSAQEYMQFVSIGTVVLWAAFLRGSRLALLPLPLLVTAIFLSSARGAVVVTIVACVIVWAVQGRTLAAWGPRLILALLLAGSGLFWSLQQVQTETYDKRTQALISHQVKGLLNPADTTHNTSTATAHANMVTQGIVEGFRVPTGHGLGATTIAAGKFNENNREGGTEIDVSDIFASLGFAGGLVYVGVMFFVLSGVVQWWRATRSLAALASLGIVVTHIGHWLHGGSYAATMVVWFVIGSMERALLALRSEPLKADTLKAAQSKITGERSQPEDTPIAASSTSMEDSSAGTAKTGEAIRPMRQDTPRARWQAWQKLPLKSDHLKRGSFHSDKRAGR